MKSIFTFLLFISLQNLFAQQDVYLNINHFLGDSPFALNQMATNDLGDEFNVSRLEYYVSEITLTHDGGSISEVSDFWILVNAENTTSVYLGSFPIMQLESISFSVGVEPAFNHLDPSTYPIDHPLGPKSPSMHWGWTSGYRFLAMEGALDVDNLIIYEIHALGDANYLNSMVVAGGKMENGNLMINLDGDYEKLLSQIELSPGIIEHGETGLPAEVLSNCSQFVFSASAGDPLGVKNNGYVEDVEIYPNPSNGWVRFSSRLKDPVQVKVFDVLGKEVKNVSGVDLNSLTLSLESKGLFLVNLYQSGNLIYSNRLSVY